MSVYEQTKTIIIGMISECDEMAGNKTLPSAARITAERIMDLIDRQGYKSDNLRLEEALERIESIDIVSIDDAYTMRTIAHNALESR